MAHNNRKYVVFDLTEVDTIDFDEVMETTADTLRKNITNTQSFVKYEGNEPVSVSALITKSESYTHEQMIILLNGEDWNDPNEPTALV